MTDLRTAAQQALEALEVATNCLDGYYIPRGKTTLPEIEDAITALRAALAEPVQEPDLSRCPKCNGPADNGHDREVPPNPYYCTKCMAEPVQEPWEHLKQYGYAPGSYMSRCHACDKIASGVDKRAITCRPCAEARHATLAEPAFHGFMSADGTRVDLCFTPGAPRADGVYATAYYTAPPQRPAEPVAYSVGRTLHWHEGKGVNDAQLFATPPQRKPLAEWQINDLMADIDPEDRDSWSFRQGVYAAEKHHGVRK